jgi:nitrite reductase/ring-hydroxylating ferredoxin subunit
MKREEFLKTCGFACLGSPLLGVLLEGCVSSGKTVGGTMEQSDLIIPVAAFQNKESFRKYVVVQHEKLKYPVCVYRFSETEYTALLMRCPHQGAELQVFGSRLQCPAHGSEFDNKGVVENGPADTNLRTFPVTEHNHQLYISLK